MITDHIKELEKNVSLGVHRLKFELFGRYLECDLLLCMLTKIENAKLKPNKPTDLMCVWSQSLIRIIIAANAFYFSLILVRKWDYTMTEDSSQNHSQPFFSCLLNGSRTNTHTHAHAYGQKDRELALIPKPFCSISINQTKNHDHLWLPQITSQQQQQQT